MKQREELWDSTRRAHNRIHNSALDLYEMADAVDYLHPHMATSLCKIADAIRESSEEIKNNASSLVQLELNDSQRAFSDTLSALLKHVDG